MKASAEMEEAVFTAAQSLDDVATRRAFLERWFAGDAGSLAAMEALLAASSHAAEFFLEARDSRASLAGEIVQQSSPDFQNPSAPAGTDHQDAFIGPYHLGGRIGEGTYGVVYEALQTHPMERRVALKLVRMGMDTETVIARFATERQALLLMDHPNIAKVLDAGVTSLGRPFFVMERAGDDHITTYCDAHALGVRARLALFLDVCGAIQHAHQKGVIHRDIKPSNILISEVDGVPSPKVIDFGVAKATHDSKAIAATVTSGDDLIGTPAYMSPEQIDLSGIDVDTRSDVYALGALLHELLSGRPLFPSERFVGTGLRGIRKAIMDEVPALPSAVLANDAEALAAAAKACGSDPHALLAFARGDLDLIVAKATAKDRNIRYQTANALAEDVRRFLACKPVFARKPSRFYLADRFFRRNKAASLASLAALLFLLAALGITLAMYRREHISSREQTRLRGLAEIATRNEAAQRTRAEDSLAVETRLREEAKKRESLSLAAMLLSLGETEEAANVLKAHPPEGIAPSPEAAMIFRSVGERQALSENWKKAARCYELLIAANLYLPKQEEINALDLLQPGPAMLEGDRRDAFEVYRADLVRRAESQVISVQAAERLLKCVLLIPSDAATLASLAPVADRVAAPILSGRPAYPGSNAWGSFSLAIYEFRRGNIAGMNNWIQISRQPSDPLTADREASLLCLEAMGHWTSGNKTAANASLAKATALFASGRVHPTDVSQRRSSLDLGWWDCATARILYKEASAMLGTPRN